MTSSSTWIPGRAPYGRLPGMTSNSKAVLTYSVVIADPDPQSIFTGLNYDHVKFKVYSGSDAGVFACSSS